MAKSPKSKTAQAADAYSDDKDQERFEKTLRAALITPPKRLKDIPKNGDQP